MNGSRREIATDIAKRYTQEGTGYADRLYQLAFAIEAALKERDERAVKVLEKRIADLKSVTHPTNHNTWEQMDLADLVTAIRKECP